MGNGPDSAPNQLSEMNYLTAGDEAADAKVHAEPCTQLGPHAARGWIRHQHRRRHPGNVRYEWHEISTYLNGLIDRDGLDAPPDLRGLMSPRSLLDCISLFVLKMAPVHARIRP